MGCPWEGSWLRRLRIANEKLSTHSRYTITQDTLKTLNWHATSSLSIIELTCLITTTVH